MKKIWFKKCDQEYDGSNLDATVSCFYDLLDELWKSEP